MPQLANKCTVSLGQPLDEELISPADALIGFVWVNPERVSGTPCFAGTRVPVKHLWDYVESGESLQEFLDGFPGVTREQAVGVLEVAFDNLLGALQHQ